MKKAGLLDRNPLQATDRMIKAARADKGESKIYRCGYASYKYIDYMTRIYFRAREIEEVLEVDVFTRNDMCRGRKAPRFRIFLNKKDNAFETYDCINEKWSNAKIDNLEFGDRHICYTELPRESTTETSVLVVNRYLGTGYKMDVWSAVLEFQQHVRKDSLKKAHKLITDSIDEKMALVPELPKNWEKWVLNTGFYNFRYLFYRKDRKSGYCECCRKEVVLKQKPVHNEKGICPECGSRILYKSWNKQKQVEDRTDIAIIQKCMDGRNYVIRQFSAYKKHCKEKEYVAEMWIHEEFRTIVNEHMREQTSYEYGEFKHTGIMRWCNFGSINHGGYYGFYESRGKAALYHENLKRVLKDSDLKYFPLTEIIKSMPGQRIEVGNVLWELTTAIGTLYEKMYKMGLKNFVKDRLLYSNRQLTKTDRDRISGKPWEAIGITKDAMKQAVRLDISDRGMRILQQLAWRNVTLTDEQLCWIDRYIGPHVILRYLGVHTPHRMIRYMKENLKVEKDGENSRELHLWTDYLDMAVELHEDLTDEQLFFPQNVERAHDEEARILEEKKDRIAAAEKKEKDKIMKKNAKDIREIFDYSDDDFMIKVPTCWLDFKHEGNAQHNCVATYFDRAVQGKTIILFIRRKEEPDKSFCTVEIGKSGLRFRIVQNRIIYNKDAPEEAKEFLQKAVEEAQKKIDRKMNKAKERVSVAV